MTDKDVENRELRALLKEATKFPYVGQVLPNGYTVLSNYRNRFVLAQHMNPKVPERYATWWLDKDGDTIMGSYFVSLERAEQKFAEQCFGWFESGENIKPACSAAGGESGVMVDMARMNADALKHTDRILEYSASPADVKEVIDARGNS